MSKLDDDDKRLAQELRDRGWKVTAPPPPPPQHRCMICGMTDEQSLDDDGMELIDVRVAMAIGEEGHSDVTRFVCSEHLNEVATVLITLGFESHHHGSTTFLSNEDNPPCGGYGICPLYDYAGGMEEEY